MLLFCERLFRVFVLAGTALLALTASEASADASLAAVRLSEGWATFGQALPMGAARTGLQVGVLETQTDVKTRWADGSIRFAVVTAPVAAAGSYALREGAGGCGGFQTKIPTASVRFSMGGIDWVTRSSPEVSSDRWLSGPLVLEGRC